MLQMSEPDALCQLARTKKFNEQENSARRSLAQSVVRIPN